MANLMDSGERRAFGTGAVRDMAEGKGRCDLLPLSVVDGLFYEGNTNPVIESLRNFDADGRCDTAYLYDALTHFCQQAFRGTDAQRIRHRCGSRTRSLRHQRRPF